MNNMFMHLFFLIMVGTNIFCCDIRRNIISDAANKVGAEHEKAIERFRAERDQILEALRKECTKSLIQAKDDEEARNCLRKFLKKEEEVKKECERRIREDNEKSNKIMQALAKSSSSQ